MSKALFIAAFIPALVAVAQVQPLEPAPGNIYNEGSACKIAWSPDTTGQWSTTNIELMTGSNSAMVHLTTVATVDGTKTSSFSYTCPSVSPNAAIYFYQFSSPAAPANLTWTGRFAIADKNGKTTDPTDTQDGIAFGNGALTDPGSASPAPTYLNGAVVSTIAASGSASGNSTAGSTTVVLQSISTSITGALTAESLTTSVRGSISSATVGAATQASGSGSDTGSASSVQATDTTSGALTKSRGLQALTGLIGIAVVLTTFF